MKTGPTFCTSEKIESIDASNRVAVDEYPLQTHSWTDHKTGKTETWQSRAKVIQRANETGRVTSVYMHDADLTFLEKLEALKVRFVVDTMCESAQGVSEEVNG
jgi:hypothetical protein